MNIKNTHLLPLVMSMGMALAGCNSSGDAGGAGENAATAINIPPEIFGKADAYVRASNSFQFTPLTIDRNGDSLSFSIENVPYWASFNSETGKLAGEPTEDQVGLYENVIISVSDGHQTAALEAFSISVLNPPLGKNNISGDADTVVTILGDGEKYEGNVILTIGENETELEDAELTFKYDSDENLLEVTGTSMLPPEISNNMSLDNNFKVDVGYYSGAQINNNADYGINTTSGIRLLDDNYYLVYFINEELSFTVKDQNNGSMVPISLGIGEAQSLIITDPTDPFAYVFGYLNGTGFGQGESAHGLIPYQPLFDNTGPDAFLPLDSFDGHKVDKAKFGLGVKVFDVLSINGMRVIRDPQFSDINWNDPLNSDLHYQAGFNGSADMEFAVLGIGLFGYHLADVSATFDVGLKRQHFALQGVYQPEETDQPVWLPVRPSPEPHDKVVASVFADGTGDFSMELRGEFMSDFPPAKVSGSMLQTKDRLTLTGEIAHDTNPIKVSAKTDGATFSATLDYHVDINDDLRNTVLNDMEDTLLEVQTAIEDLTDATSNYEFELSLRGVRQSLPVIADTAISKLNALPNKVRTGVYNKVHSAIVNKDICFIELICVSAKDYVDEVSIANKAANSAKNRAQNEIVPYVNALQDLKNQALEKADDESLRQALKTALLQAYNHRNINKTFSYTFDKTFSYETLIKTYTKRWNQTFSHTVSETIIPAAEAEKILVAANNVHKIGETSNIMISIQDVVDTLPVEDAIDRARQEVENGVAQVPTFEGAGYSVNESTRTAYILLGGEKYEVVFNLLDPESVHDNIVDLISGELIGN